MTLPGFTATTKPPRAPAAQWTGAYRPVPYSQGPVCLPCWHTCGEVVAVGARYVAVGELRTGFKVCPHGGVS